MIIQISQSKFTSFIINLQKKPRNCGGMILVVGEKALGEPTPELLAAANALLNCRTKTHVAATTNKLQPHQPLGGMRRPWSYNQPTLTQYKQYERVLNPPPNSIYNIWRQGDKVYRPQASNRSEVYITFAIS